MVNWSQKKPVMGDQIRVNRKFYCHHGIYCDDNTIIHFGSTTQELDPEKAEVLISDLSTFLKGGILEVREYSEDELKRKRKPIEIVNYAFTQIGRKGYDLINNNCEHFSNECAFGEHISDQVNDIFSFLNQFKK